MANPGTGGRSTPDNEDANQFDIDQQNEDERRRLEQARLNSHRTNDEASQHNERPQRPGAPAQEKVEAPQRAWEDTLRERLNKLNDEQCHHYDALISNSKERHGMVSPDYQLGVAAMFVKKLTGNAFDKDLSDLNHKEAALAWISTEANHPNAER
jgi:hypothetical protein